jgi:hypothetical protein
LINRSLSTSSPADVRASDHEMMISRSNADGNGVERHGFGRAAKQGRSGRAAPL